MSDIKILIVDDEPDYSETMEFWLMAKGYDVSAVASGSDAITYLANEPLPDIVFLDILMPGMDGIETLKEIRVAHPKLPVIMVTAYASDERKEAAKRLGVNGFFAKADDLSLAAMLIKNVMERLEDIKS